MSKEPCPHLEALLHERKARNPPTFYGYDVENMSTFKEEKEVRSFFETLTRLGMGEAEQRLLYKKYVEDMSLSELTKEEGYTSKGSLRHHLLIILDELKRRGITYNTKERLRYKSGKSPLKNEP